MFVTFEVATVFTFQTVVYFDWDVDMLFPEMSFKIAFKIKLTNVFKWKLNVQNKTFVVWRHYIRYG